MTGLRIDAKRLLADLHELRSFGAHGTGVVRQSFSPADIASREWLVAKMRAAGLDAAIDGVGNVLGRHPRARRTLLIGSHTDTQPQGGWLDGAMGVICGLEVARAWIEQGGEGELGVDVASWIDEEGSYYNFLGSRSFCDRLPEGTLQSARSAGGEILLDAIRRAGYQDRPLFKLDPSRHLAYLEAHIEQGGVLEAAGRRIGVVTAIIGAREYRLEFVGEQNHAGTTPMYLRKDAVAAVFAFVAAIEPKFRAAASSSTVWTMGKIEVLPNSPSIIPGWAALTVQFRDTDPEVLLRMETAVRETVATMTGPNGVGVHTMQETIRVEPTAMDSELQLQLELAAQQELPGASLRMPSGAGHDAQIFKGLIPAGMLFVPSIRGVSHSFDEDTSEVDIAHGCQVLATAVSSILVGGGLRRAPDT